MYSKTTAKTEESNKALIVSMVLGGLSILLALGNYIYSYVIQFKDFLAKDQSFSDILNYIFFDAGVEYTDSILHKGAIVLMALAFIALNVIFLIKTSNPFRLAWLVVRVIEVIAGIALYVFEEKQYLMFPNVKVIIASVVIGLMEIAILAIFYSVIGCFSMDICLWVGFLVINIFNAIYYLICWAFFALICYLMWVVASFLFDNVPEPQFDVVRVFDSAGNFVGKMLVRK